MDNQRYKYIFPEPALRPSYMCEMVASQHRLLRGLERDCGVTRPLFLNSNRSWADTFLACASDLTSRSIGRYRLDFDMNKAGVQELWFDLETDGPKLKTTAWVQRKWPALKNCAARLIRLLCSQIPEDRIYLTASGSGLHVRTFVTGIQSEAHRDTLLRYLVKEAGLPNSKSSTKPGCDMPSTLSVRRKVREVGGPNTDKRHARKACYRHYCTSIPISELESLQAYPFCKYAREVAYPQRYQPVELPDAWREEALPRPSESRLNPSPTVCSPSQQTRPLSDFWKLLKKDKKLAALFYGKKPISRLKDQSRSGREQSLVSKLVYYCFTFEQIDTIMRRSKIGKWARAPESYRKKTYETAGRL